MAEIVEGIVLKTSDYQEKSKILQVFSKEHGLIGVLIKGASNYKSNGYQLAQPITHASFSIYYKLQGLSSSYGGEVINGFKTLKTDFHKNVYVYHLFELVLKTIEQHHEVTSLYELLLLMVQFIDETEEETQMQLWTLLFEIKLLFYLGIMPELNACVECGANKGIVNFDIYKGGFVCRNCHSVHSKPYSIATLKQLVDLVVVNRKDIAQMMIPDQSVLYELREILDEYYDHHLGVRTNSRKYINIRK